MTARACSIDGCERPRRVRGWCNAHWKRWEATGDTRPGVPLREIFRDPEDAFAARTAWDGEHLLWIGADDSRGYGKLRVGSAYMKAHRFSWARVNGEIPPGIHIDHICHTPACVLPEHLRAATVPQNMANRGGASVNNRGTGIRNVYTAGDKFRVQIVKGRKIFHLGTFDTVEEASAAAQAGRAELFGEFAGAS